MIGPNALELLATTRELLLGEMLPALPEQLHYECRMAASAMAMAAREIEHGARVLRIEADALEQVLNLHGLAGLTAEDARAMLCQFIRQGLFDQPGPSRDMLLHALGEITRARLSVSNPKVVGHGR